MKHIDVSLETWHKICDLRKKYNLQNNNEVIKSLLQYSIDKKAECKMLQNQLDKFRGGKL